MNAQDETYQGWANRETWALMLHINNDQGLYNEFRELVREDSEVREATGEMQDAVRERVEEVLYPEEWAQSHELAMMAREVGSLWRVDWSEVVASLLED